MTRLDTLDPEPPYRETITPTIDPKALVDAEIQASLEDAFHQWYAEQPDFPPYHELSYYEKPWLMRAFIGGYGLAVVSMQMAADGELERCCRVCGCSDERSCLDPCHWVEPDLCSNCRPRIIVP